MNTLPMRPTEAVQIGNSCFSFVKRDGRVEYFSNLEPFDFHADDQREARLLRIAKFAESGVRRSDLVEALGVSRSTVQRNGIQFAVGRVSLFSGGIATD